MDVIVDDRPVTKSSNREESKKTMFATGYYHICMSWCKKVQRLLLKKTLKSTLYAPNAILVPHHKQSVSV